MTQEELDKLAEKYQDDNTIIRYYGPGNGTVQEYNKTMAEVFKDGWNACMEQMLKKAVEADIELTLHDKTGDVSLHTGYLPKELGIKCDDKVRIIIIKED